MQKVNLKCEKSVEKKSLGQNGTVERFIFTRIPWLWKGNWIVKSQIDKINILIYLQDRQLQSKLNFQSSAIDAISLISTCIYIYAYIAFHKQQIIFWEDCIRILGETGNLSDIDILFFSCLAFSARVKRSCTILLFF